VYNIPETGSTETCPYCSLKPANGHSISQSAQCDGIKNGSITGTRAMEIRMKNGLKPRKSRVQADAD